MVYRSQKVLQLQRPTKTLGSTNGLIMILRNAVMRKRNARSHRARVLIGCVSFGILLYCSVAVHSPLRSQNQSFATILISNMRLIDSFVFDSV
ncbi:unnamed protein product [Anisakis simplex]|uniref:Heparan-sulfate 6-O-sulfotransferase n=1 Tax=Anisakis simplex TaxID=6269 RepID=A0A0M3JQA4_ANISI|nr:unnamed protein product [Anisakis simplex]